jgi:hypothetical protein
MVHSTSNKCRRRGIVSPQKMVPSRSRRYNPKRVRFASDLATTSPSAADRTATQIRWCAKTTKTRCTFSLENRKALWWDDRSLAQSRCESRALAEQYESSPYQAALWFLWQTPWCHGGNIAVSSSFWLRHSLHWLVACSDLRGLEQRVCPSLKLFRLRSSRAVLRLQHVKLIVATASSPNNIKLTKHPYPVTYVCRSNTQRTLRLQYHTMIVDYCKMTKNKVVSCYDVPRYKRLARLVIWPIVSLKPIKSKLCAFTKKTRCSWPFDDVRNSNHRCYFSILDGMLSLAT